MTDKIDIDYFKRHISLVLDDAKIMLTEIKGDEDLRCGELHLLRAKLRLEMLKLRLEMLEEQC
jgi:hypothetical protein